MTTFELSRGDDKTYEATLTDGAGVPIDLSALAGTDLTFTVRRRPHTATALVTKTIGAGITVTDAPAGKCTVALAAADTSGLGNWRQTFGWDIQAIIAGKTSTVAEGKLVVKPDYTHA